MGEFADKRRPLPQSRLHTSQVFRCLTAEQASHAGDRPVHRRLDGPHAVLHPRMRLVFYRQVTEHTRGVQRLHGLPAQGVEQGRVTVEIGETARNGPFIDAPDSDVEPVQVGRHVGARRDDLPKTRQPWRASQAGRACQTCGTECTVEDEITTVHELAGPGARVLKRCCRSRCLAIMRGR